MTRNGKGFVTHAMVYQELREVHSKVDALVQSVEDIKANCSKEDQRLCKLEQSNGEQKIQLAYWGGGIVVGSAALAWLANHFVK